MKCTLGESGTRLSWLQNYNQNVKAAIKKNILDDFKIQIFVQYKEMIASIINFNKLFLEKYKCR